MVQRISCATQGHKMHGLGKWLLYSKCTVQITHCIFWQRTSTPVVLLEYKPRYQNGYINIRQQRSINTASTLPLILFTTADQFTYYLLILFILSFLYKYQNQLLAEYNDNVMILSVYRITRRRRKRIQKLIQLGDAVIFQINQWYQTNVIGNRRWCPPSGTEVHASVILFSGIDVTLTPTCSYSYTTNKEGIQPIES